MSRRLTSFARGVLSVFDLFGVLRRSAIEGAHRQNSFRWPGEVCKRCQRRNTVGFHVPEELWRAIVKGRWSLLCLTCFDEVAEAEKVEYDIPQRDLYPVSWSAWKRP